MKLLLKAAGVLLVGVLLAGSAGAAYFFWRYPGAGPAPQLRIDSSPARVERGKYLANHVSVCIDCHSTREWKTLSGPIVRGTEGEGGERFGEENGFPGTIFASNITPAHLGGWTDGEILRAITSGVSRDGTALFPVMPYLSYNRLSVDDAGAIVAYIRTLKPLESETPARRLNFPMNVIVRTMPKPGSGEPAPDRTDAVSYGQYLTTVAACAECHTPMRDGTRIEGMAYAGGSEFRLPDGSTSLASNITPDEQTGIGSWTKELFIDHFRAFGPGNPPGLATQQFSTVMPWTMYAGMTDEDLGAMYTYLRTVKPVRHEVSGVRQSQ
ncbi:MAG: c-type cytochrome [Acidobacteria bacterium]|nr:c-type cytochrome [Acidobacteriota bacterium]